MKRLAYILITALLLTACRNEPTPAPDKQVTSDSSISQYFPIKHNVFYEYKSSPVNSADQQIYVAYTNGSRIQRRITSSFSETTEVLDIQNGELRLVYYEPQYYYYENITSVQPTMDVLLLKEPLITGQSWKMDDTADCEITGMEVPIETSLGSFTAMEVTTRYNTGIEQKEYYVKGTGLVKIEYNSGEQVEIELAAMTENASLDIFIDYFYPSDDGSNVSVVKEERIIKVNTNSVLDRAFEKEFRTAGAGQSRSIMTENAKINEMFVERSTNTVFLDMNDSFVSEMNAGVEYENMILQSVANTVGTFFDADKIRLTINGKNYESGHIIMTDEDFIPVERDEQVPDEVSGHERSE